MATILQRWFISIGIVLLGISGCLSLQFAKAEDSKEAGDSQKKEVAQSKETKSWADRIHFRGYTQIRYNRLFETNRKLRCDQCDRSWGDNSSLFIRRARLVFFGDVHERVYIYIQPDLATTLTGQLNSLQMRDLYFDLALDSKKEYRLRFGQSKVPFGWEDLQSSANRIPLDRTDAINSAVPNERDVGVFFYWAPLEIRKRFRELVETGLKGSGDYGVFGFGPYVGQSLNRSELNNNLHVVARLTYPFKLPSGQFMEPSIQAYSGLFTLPKGDSSLRGTSVQGETVFPDQRIGVSWVYYPQPIGFQAEANIGRGPEYQPSSNSIETQALKGGYLQVMAAIRTQDNQMITPFARVQYYKGGKKQELDARRYLVRDYEVGVEWQVYSAFEVTAEYVVSTRTFEDSSQPSNQQTGNLLRLQAQFNY